MIFVDIVKTWLLPAIASSPKIAGGAFLRPDAEGRLLAELPAQDIGQRDYPFVFAYYPAGTGSIVGEVISGGSYRECQLMLVVAYRYRVSGDNSDAEEAGHALADEIGRRMWANVALKPHGLRHFSPAGVPVVELTLPKKSIATVVVPFNLLVKATEIGFGAAA